MFNLTSFGRTYLNCIGGQGRLFRAVRLLRSAKRRAPNGRFWVDANLRRVIVGYSERGFGFTVAMAALYFGEVF